MRLRAILKLFKNTGQTEQNTAIEKHKVQYFTSSITGHLFMQHASLIAPNKMKSTVLITGPVSHFLQLFCSQSPENSRIFCVTDIGEYSKKFDI